MTTPLGGVPSVALRPGCRAFLRAQRVDRISSVPRFQGSVRWMSVPTLPHLNGPRARGFACKPLQHEACASSLSHAHSLAQQPTRSSAYTVPGRARDSHPHSLKRAHPSPTPASCPTQPSLPITPGFYHVLHGHVQKRPRMWHSSAAPTHAAVGTFCFPGSKSRQRKTYPQVLRHSARKEPNMPHSSPFLNRNLARLAFNNIHPSNPLRDALRPIMRRTNDLFRMRAIQYACPNKPFSFHGVL